VLTTERIAFVAAAETFEVNEAGEGSNGYLEAVGADAAAEVDVVAGDGEILVKLADRQEQVAWNHETCAGDGGDVAWFLKFAAYAGKVGGLASVEVGPAACAGGVKADMLNGGIGIKERGAADADAWGSGEAEKVVEPMGVDHLRVVIEKKKKVARGVPGAKVAKPRKIEGTGIGNDVQATALLDSREQAAGAGAGAPVVDEDDLEPLVLGEPKTLQQVLEQTRLIAEGDDNADLAGRGVREIRNRSFQERDVGMRAPSGTKPGLERAEPGEEAPGTGRVDVAELRIQIFGTIPFTLEGLIERMDEALEILGPTG